SGHQDGHFCGRYIARANSLGTDGAEYQVSAPAQDGTAPQRKTVALATKRAFYYRFGFMERPFSTFGRPAEPLCWENGNTATKETRRQEDRETRSALVSLSPPLLVSVSVSSAWPRTLLRPTAQGLLYYVLTSFVTVFGVLIGHGLLVPCPGYMRSPESIASFRNWDGSWYLNIMMNGYSFDPTGPSSVAFFPAYPLLVRLLPWATRLRPHSR